MIHVACLADALHKLAKEILENYSDVGKLTSNVRKILVKAIPTVETFGDLANTLIPLSSKPTDHQMGTWLGVAILL